MRAAVDDLVISFDSADSLIRSGWQLLFDLEIERARNIDLPQPDLRLNAQLVSELPDLPARPPDYEAPAVPESARPVRFYEDAAGGILRLARPAQIHFNFNADSAEIYLASAMLDSGSLEDITMTALAPFFRRRGVYMAHAFAVSNTIAVLFCGPSGSGKTTAGLATLNDGWRFLANDVTLLRKDQGAVHAFPSPGAINLDPTSLTFLPGRRTMNLEEYPLTLTGKRILPRRAVLSEDELGGGAPVSTVLFPRLHTAEHSAVQEIAAAVGLARLIEDSVDQWDHATYEEHIDFLTDLSRQARFYHLSLPRGSQATHPQLTTLINSLH
jgi:hypothetical protein